MEPLRLNKFISYNTHYSRREADELVRQGRVSIDGKTVSDLALKVTDKHLIRIDKKKIIHDENRMYTVIVYNKPKGELVTKHDPQGRRTIFDSLGKAHKNFMPIGRLDYASEGLLLLTDSVKVYNALVHSDLERIYKIKVNGLITTSCEDAMLNGLDIEDASKGAHKNSTIMTMSFKPFNAYQIQSNNAHFSKLKVSISQGQNRELRRFFSHFDLDVMDLKRLEFGGVSLNNLPTGKSRYFTRKEYQDLKAYIQSSSHLS